MGADSWRPFRSGVAARLADPGYRAELAAAKAWGLTPSDFRALSEDDQAELVAYVREVCPSCGNLRSECSDPDRVWYPQRDVCYASAAEQQIRRKLNRKHKPVAHDDPEPHEMDGVHVWASLDDLSPDDDFV